VGESNQTAISFASSFGLTFPVLLDASSLVYSSYSINGITPFPRDCIIDQQGIVRYLHSEYDPFSMKQTIDEILLTSLSYDDFVPKSLDLEIYPNPTNSSMKIEFPVQDLENYTISIYDVTGKLLNRQNYKNYGGESKKTHILNLDQQSSGIYILTVQSDQWQISRKITLVR
jgi:hypothetical protein